MPDSQPRLIYTAGTQRLTDPMRQARRLIVRADVLRRPPSARYQNERSNPPKFFFGYVSLWIGQYVQAVFPLEYEAQIVFMWDNLHLQNNHALYCISANLSRNLTILGSAMTPPALVQLTQEQVPLFPGCPVEWIKFKLEPLTRIQVSCSWEEPYACPDIQAPISLPIFNDDVPPYPSDRPLINDPARSFPEPGELAGDTAPPSPADPDASLLDPISKAVRFYYTDLVSNSNSRFIISAPFPAVGEVTLGNVIYSNAQRRAEVVATDSAGVSTTVLLFNNSSNSGTATQLSVVNA